MNLKERDPVKRLIMDSTANVNSTKELTDVLRVAVGVELEKARLRAGMTQQNIAELLNTHQSIVNRYESGERAVSLADFIKLGLLLKFSIAHSLERIRRQIGPDPPDLT